MNNHQNRVTVIPANPEAVKEAQKRKERRDTADAIISLLQSKRDKLAEEIMEMKERCKELEKELSEL